MTIKMEDSESETEPFLVNNSQSQLNRLKKDIPWPSCRFVFSLTCFLGFVNVYALRVNLSVALVAMVNQSVPVVPINGTADCPGQVLPNETHTQTGEFNWDDNLQGYVLGSFFYGYISTQLLGGRLAEVTGGKLLYGIGVFCTAVLTLLTPVAARWSPYAFMVLRILEGFGEGVTFPAMHSILSKWASPLERSKMGTFIYAGAQMGTVISMPLSGVICDKLGWEYVFYIFGALGCVWFLFYLYLVYDDPHKHPRISPEELSYLDTALGSSSKKKSPPVPWTSIFTSVPVYALIAAHFSYNWGFYTLLTSLPKYMASILHFDISSNGFVSALPYLVMWVVIVITGQGIDTLLERRKLSRTAARKLANTVGFTCPAISLVIVSYLGCDTVAAVTVLCIGGGLAGISQSGYNVNHLDLAPEYAGTLMGISNTVATIPGFMAPEVVGWITNGQNNVANWQKVFFISTGIYVFGALAFGIFGSGERQPWAQPQLTEDEEEEEDNEHSNNMIT